MTPSQSVETLSKITDGLKTRYMKLVNEFSDSSVVDVLSLSIPKRLSPYQFHFNDLYRKSQEISDDLDELYYNKMLSYKVGQSELSVVDLNSSEIKRMIESSEDYRMLKQKYDQIVADMKIVEEMISTIKNFSFNVNNSLKFKELTGGSA